MSETERLITVASLINAAVFYIITVVVFLVTRKTRLNKALALQKADWLGIILLIALPSYLLNEGLPVAPSWLRMLLWVNLSIATWWVLYEVYRANWSGGWRALLRLVWCNIKRSLGHLVGRRSASC